MFIIKSLVEVYIFFFNLEDAYIHYAAIKNNETLIQYDL